ncbi:sugar kinase [Desulfovibrio sp. OttesenSCG-928-C14]|nr:sugar kinase [Desulfovibrio sp. OttesenSCG-928-C14]
MPSSLRWLICGTFPEPEARPGRDEDPPALFGRVSVSLKAGAALRAGDAPGTVAGAAPGAAPGTAEQTRPGQAGPADCLIIEREGASEVRLPIGRGTPALAAAAALTAAECGAPAPYVLLAQDNGQGQGSRAVYRYLLENAASLGMAGLTFHYLLPDVDWHNRLLIALEDLEPRPLLCADAGFMYAAKMSGYAAEYDLFTPDIGELAFLADEKAPHPFYTRGFLLAREDEAPDLLARAYANDNAARTMIVKGRTDLVARSGRILHSVDYPMIPNLEPIGGTGDSVAGTVTGLLSAALPMDRACLLACLAVRFMGQLCQPSPATQIAELLAQLPGGLRLAFQEESQR